MLGIKWGDKVKRWAWLSFLLTAFILYYVLRFYALAHAALFPIRLGW